jgi:hypothetical protein
MHMEDEDKWVFIWPIDVQSFDEKKRSEGSLMNKKVCFFLQFH